MIPKKIHYIWVGGKEKPKEVKRCINTWKQKFKDFEIIEWNESNFNINSNLYTKSAYEAKKWAFVSDYIRLYALYTMGGIYLDTDVIAVDNIDDMLDNKAFIGFENEKFVSAAIMGAEKEHPFIKQLIEHYDKIDNKKEFCFDDNNSLLVTDILKNYYGLELNNKEQTLDDGIKVYNDKILSNPSGKSKTIHIFTGTWLDEKPSLKKKICQFLKYRLTTKKRAKIYAKIFKK